jgi:hypothetical protein
LEQPIIDCGDGREVLECFSIGDLEGLGRYARGLKRREQACAVEGPYLVVADDPDASTRRERTKPLWELLERAGGDNHFVVPAGGCHSQVAGIRRGSSRDKALDLVGDLHGGQVIGRDHPVRRSSVAVRPARGLVMERGQRIAREQGTVAVGGETGSKGLRLRR